MTNGPPNFRNMKFPPSRYGNNAVYAPLQPAPPARTITMNEKERRAIQLKEMKAFCNQQRCPLCDSQLEGQVGFDRATLYCVANEKEYKVAYKFGFEKPIWSRTTYFTTHFAYEVDNKHLLDELYENVIYKVDLSYNEKFQQISKQEILKYEGSLLRFKTGLTEDQLLEKIKLYNLFS